MKYYAGLDVSVKETSVCVLDQTGQDAVRSRSRAIPKTWRGHWRIRTVRLNVSVLRPGRCRNGCSAGWLREACPSSASRRGIPRRF